jgi:predicted N-acetyltransferase YhbS
VTSIRKATKQDISRILALYEELTEEKQNLSTYTIGRVFAEITSSPNMELLVAEKDGLVVGTLFLQIVPNLTHNARPWAILENIVVDGRYHRKGVGLILIESAFTRAKQAGCYKVQLLSNKKRNDAHQFYRSMGFEDSALGFRRYL